MGECILRYNKSVYYNTIAFVYKTSVHRPIKGSLCRYIVYRFVLVEIMAAILLTCRK